MNINKISSSSAYNLCKNITDVNQYIKRECKSEKKKNKYKQKCV